MGGLPPLGYDVADRKLIANPAEAEAVRELFRLYLELGNVRLLKDEADRQGLFTKKRTRDGFVYGGKPFSRGNLYQLLRNPLYVGEVAHKGKSYSGQHEAIIERETWDAVQSRLSENAPARRTDKNTRNPSLLTGLVYDETGDLLSPSHATKKGRRYRYYISRRIMHGPDPHGDGWRIPANELEAAVLQSVSAFLRDGKRLIETLPPNASVAQNRRLIRGGAELAEALAKRSTRDQLETLRQVIRRATLGRTIMRIEISGRDIRAHALGAVQSGTDPNDPAIQLELPISFRRRGIESKLVLRSASKAAPDPKLIALVARARRWMDELVSGRATSVREIARREQLDESDVSRYLPLAFLASDIVGAMVEGWQPMELTADALRCACPIPWSWKVQREVFERSAPR